MNSTGEGSLTTLGAKPCNGKNAVGSQRRRHFPWPLPAAPDGTHCEGLACKIHPDKWLIIFAVVRDISGISFRETTSNYGHLAKELINILVMRTISVDVDKIRTSVIRIIEYCHNVCEVNVPRDYRLLSP